MGLKLLFLTFKIFKNEKFYLLLLLSFDVPIYWIYVFIGNCSLRGSENLGGLFYNFRLDFCVIS
jgi:hypothetical protein